MKTKDEIKKDLLNNKKLQDENETSITRIIEQMPDQRILISESEGIYGQIFNGQHGSIKYVKGEKEQVIIRFSGGIGPVYKMDTAWGLQLNFNHLKIILTTENAVKYIKNHFYLTPSQTQKLMEILSYYVEDNTGTGNYLDYSPSPIKILDGVIHVDYEIGNNSKILSDLFNFYPKATHPDYFLENLGYNLISPFHNDLKHLGNSVIQTPLLLAEGVTKGAKTSIPVFFIGKGFALPKDKFLYGLERVKTQADLNVHANETNIPMIIDDVKTSWLEKNKDSLKSYVQTGVFADRGKQNGIELNELKGQRSIIFTLNDKYKIDTDLAITNRIFIERFTKFHSGRRNKPLFLKFEKSMPSGFMYSLIRELFDGKKIIDIYNEVENLEDPIDWLNYGIQYINSLCKKYNLPEFPSLKAKKLLDHDTNAMEVAQKLIEAENSTKEPPIIQLKDNEEINLNLTDEEAEKAKRLHLLYHINVMDDHVTVEEILPGKPSRIFNIYIKKNGNDYFRLWCEFDDSYDCWHVKAAWTYPQVQKMMVHYKGKTKICSACGFENPEEALFCMKCGTKLD